MSVTLKHRIICIFCISFLLLNWANETSAQQKPAEINVPTPEIPTLPVPQTDTVTICLLGDMMMHEAQIAAADQGDGTYDFSSYFRHIKDDISSADIAIANMEFTLAGAPYSGYPCFSAPESFATYLKDCGFDIFLAANNHIYDKGGEGAARTLEFYRNLGIKYTGIAYDSDCSKSTTPLKLMEKDISIALINMTYGTNLGISTPWPKVNYINNRTLIEKAFQDAQDCDFVIALPHWGEEYDLTHSQKQEETAKWLISKGADLIVGTHPHVVQDSQEIDGVPVAYSLGNAVSNMSAVNTQIELMVKIRITREGKRKVAMLPPEFIYLWCSRPGGYGSSYTVLPVSEFIGTRGSWQGPWEYDKMIATYERVQEITGIKE